MRARRKTTGKKKSRHQAGSRAFRTAALASGAVIISAVLIVSVLFASGPLWKQSRAVELANKTATNTVTGMLPENPDENEGISEAPMQEEDSTAPSETEEAGADTGTRSIESALTGKPVPAATVNVKTQAEREAERTPLAQYFRDKAIINKETAGEYLEIYTVPEKGDESTLADVATEDTILQLLGEKDGWSNVGMGEISGWVPTECLLTGVQAAEYIEQTADPYAQIAVDSMNIRMGKSTGSDILDVGYKGEAYPLVSIEDGWACVKLGDVLCGYLAGNCVTINYDWNGLVIATEIAGAAEDEVKNLAAVRPTESSAETELPEQSSPEATQPSDPASTAPVSQPDESGSSSSAPVTDPAAQPTDSAAQPTDPTTPAVQQTDPAQSEPTAPQPTDPQSTEPQSTEPQPTDPQPTEPQPTESEPTVPPAVTGIEAFYIGSQQKVEGEVMSRAEICVYVYYSDGSIQVLDGNGDWYSEDIGMMLHAPEDVIKVEYAGCVSNIVLEIAAAPTQPEATEPEQTEPQPTEPEQTEPQPTEPTEPEQTEPQPTEPQPTPPDEAYVNNVALSGELTAYALRLCSQYGVDSSVIFSVMYQESKFNPGAASASGAIGLMQIIPGYSQARMQKLGVTDLFDAKSNMLVGIDMLAEYYYQYGGWVPALTRYRYGSPSASGDYASLILSRTGMFQ